MLSIQGRQALAKLTLPLSFLVSIALLLLGVVRPSAVEAVRIRAADSLAPAYRILAVPGSVLTRLKTDLAGLIELSAENARLREENVRLRQWYNVAVTLADENAQLKANLHWIPDEAPRFVSGHVFRDASGLYGHSVLLDVGLSHSIHPGDVALDSSGLIGRVTEIGARTVRILLINDDASRLPVSLGSSHASAIMAGDGSRYPRLIYYAQDNRPIEGERVVTQEQAPPQAPPRAQGALAGLPGGLLVGTVHYLQPGSPVVVPEADLGHPDILRVFNFRAADNTGPEAPGRIRVLVPLPEKSGLPFLPLMKATRGLG